MTPPFEPTPSDSDLEPATLLRRATETLKKDGASVDTLRAPVADLVQSLKDDGASQKETLTAVTLAVRAGLFDDPADTDAAVLFIAVMQTVLPWAAAQYQRGD